MLASIVLDQGFSHYTNLDIISGKVHVRTPASANISSIVVKLEGESRTRLLPPPSANGDRQKAQLEFHKVSLLFVDRITLEMMPNFCRTDIIQSPNSVPSAKCGRGESEYYYCWQDYFHATGRQS